MLTANVSLSLCLLCICRCRYDTRTADPLYDYTVAGCVRYGILLPVQQAVQVCRVCASVRRSILLVCCECKELIVFVLHLGVKWKTPPMNESCLRWQSSISPPPVSNKRTSPLRTFYVLGKLTVYWGTLQALCIETQPVGGVEPLFHPLHAARTAEGSGAIHTALQGQSYVRLPLSYSARAALTPLSAIRPIVIPNTFADLQPLPSVLRHRRVTAMAYGALLSALREPQSVPDELVAHALFVLRLALESPVPDADLADVLVC